MSFLSTAPLLPGWTGLTAGGGQSPILKSNYIRTTGQYFTQADFRRICFESYPGEDQAWQRVIHRHDLVYGTSLEQRYLDCHTQDFYAQYLDTDDWTVRFNNCQVPGCRLCGQKRTNFIFHRLLEFFTKQPDYTVRTLVLTQKSSDDPLLTQIDRLQKNFHKLRRWYYWSEKTGKRQRPNVTSFFAFRQEAWIEGKKGKRGHWHVHLHILILGNRLEQKMVSRQWGKITGNSMIVHISRVDMLGVSLGRTLSDAVRYVSRPGNLQEIPGGDHLLIPDDKQLELYHARLHRRSFLRGGDCCKIKLKPDPLSPAEKRRPSRERGKWSYINNLAADGDLICQQIVLAERFHTPYRPPAWWTKAGDTLENSSRPHVGLSESEKCRPPPLEPALSVDNWSY